MTADEFSSIELEGLRDRLGLPGDRLRRDLFHLRRMLGSFGVKGRRVLEIGCGPGVYCILMALAGAERVVGLEPEAAGARNGTLEALNRNITALGLTNLAAAPTTLQEYDLSAAGPFDVVLSKAVVNHLAEDACSRLHRDEQARAEYRAIFRSIRQALNPGGMLIVADCGRHNLFSGTSRLGLFRGLARTIDWDLHQSPGLWRRLLEESGFGGFELEYWVPYRLRHLGRLVNNRVFSYLTLSYFILRAFVGGEDGPTGLPAGPASPGRELEHG